MYCGARQGRYNRATTSKSRRYGGRWTLDGRRRVGGRKVEGGVEQCPTAAVGTDTSRFSKIARVDWVSPSPQRMDKHGLEGLDSTRASLAVPRVAVSPFVLTAPLQTNTRQCQRAPLLHPTPLALIGHRRRWPRNNLHDVSTAGRTSLFLLAGLLGTHRPSISAGAGHDQLSGSAISLALWDRLGLPPPGPATRVFLAAPSPK
ncbi:hypothetical protein QBC39DRAFT_349613 [Podospora conica]|nr:hypothetical protein QBC39DRAFT_349613 [Schizothecium conicum]